MLLLDNKVTVVQVVSPFSMEKREVATREYHAGMLLSDVLSPVPLISGVEWFASVNGKVVQDLATKLHPGDSVVLVPVVQDSEVLRVAAFITLVAASAGWGEALGFEIFSALEISVSAATLTAVGAGLIMAGGGMLINAVLPPPTPDLGSSGGATGLSASPTYSWGPLTAREGQGAPIPYLFGKMRVAGQVLSKYVSSDGSKQYLHVLIGIADGTDTVAISDVRINDQPVSNYDGVTVVTRSGGVGDEVIPGFDRITAQSDFNSKIDTTGVTKDTQGNEVDTIEVDVAFPYGLYYANDSGGLDQRTVSLVFYVGLVGQTLAYHGQLDVTEATSQAVRRTYVMAGLPAGQYSYEVVRLAEEASNTRTRDAVYLVCHREIITQNLTYPGVAKLAVVALATDQLSGGMPRIDCLAERTYVQVYNPYTDTWVSKNANNPAWAYYGFWVSHMGVDPSRMLYDEIAAWASYCAEVIQMDTGGTDRRFDIGLYIDTPSDAWTVAQTICSVGRARPIRRGSKYGVVSDRPSIPVQSFNTSNTTNFKMKYISSVDKADSVEVTYKDEENDYNNQVVSVYTQQYDTSSLPDRKASFVAYGSTSRSQAIREGVSRLNVSNNTVRVLTFDASIDAIALQTGDLFYYSHDAVSDGVSGRLVGATTTHLVVDSLIRLVAGSSYSVIVSKANGTILDMQLAVVAPQDPSVVNGVLITDTLTLAAAIADPSNVPEQFDTYIVGGTSTYKRVYRCTSMSRVHDLTKTITGAEYSDLTEADTQYILGAYDQPVKKAIAFGVSAHEYLVASRDGSYVSQINVSWLSAASDPTQPWEVWVIHLSEAGRVTGPLPASGLSYVVPHTLLRLGCSYRIAVVAAATGLRNTGSNTASVTIDGKGDPPGDVSTFTVSTHADGTRVFVWTMLDTPPDIAGFRIRYHAGLTDVAWDSMLDITTQGLLRSAPYETNALAAGNYTFGIKAVNTSGVESLNFLAIKGTLPNPRMGNALYIEDFWPTWSNCTLTNCAIDPVTRYLAVVDTKTWVDLAGTEWGNWHSWYQAPAPSLTLESGVIDVGVVVPVTVLINVICEGSPTATVRTSEDNSVWTDWGVPGNVTGRFFQFRVVVDNTVTPASVSQVSLILSGETVTEDVNDLNTLNVATAYRVGVGHIKLPLLKSYATITQVMLALQSVGSGWTWEVVSKASTVNGKLAPEIKIYNSSGVAADAVIDVTVKGV